ncbi:hypothetical protein P9695_14925 [Weizmannia sp. CD-2023]|uniref:hypothetical protein n=1 Tax=Heyndrickxia TaxID=2837504 RepID=UPI002E21FCB9|nr:hypothetical protein [Weizmannia sp. CD-2023]MED4899791.1 hypothetical protein [Weizmannia sp. CD-2023]
MYDGLFKKGTDFKATFAEEVQKLVSKDVDDCEIRNKLVNVLVEAYLKQTDQRPDKYQLAILANWILAEEKNKHPDKVTKTEYPILTSYQLKVRRRREFANENIENFTDSCQYRVSGKHKPKRFKVFGNY